MRISDKTRQTLTLTLGLLVLGVMMALLCTKG